MAAAVAATSVKHNGTATVSLTGDSATTARMIHITDPDGRTQNFPVTTDGSGNATVTFVPQLAGSYTVTVLSIAGTVCTSTANSSHF